MMAIEAAIAKMLVDVVITGGVDVVSRRAPNPTVRGLARAYKVFSLVSPVEGMINAVRISAYSDAASLMGHEAIIELSSRKIAQTLTTMNNINYEIHRLAERYVIGDKFTLDLDSEWHVPLLYNSDFAVKDYSENCKPLSDIVSKSASRAVRAYEIASELARYPEASQDRGTRRWNRPETWVDRVNFQLGHLFWQPIPEIGLGKRKVGSNDAVYYGTFRRDTAEGYALIEMPNGFRYYGQTSHGFPRGYGVSLRPDGSVYIGRVYSAYRLGITLSPKRDWIYYGEHASKGSRCYGRRIGLKDGVESVNAFWVDDQPTARFSTSADTYRKIAETMVADSLRSEYQSKAAQEQAAVEMADSQILSFASRFL